MTYLSHRDILAALPEMEFRTPITEYPFTEDQVKVCSIDLRCDRVFWMQRTGPGSLDLAGAALMEISPRRLWKKLEIELNSPVKLKPGQMILGRTYERFRVPPLYAGKITGRSSYARLGIEVSCTCDLINPGWEGNVPLEIVNNGARPVLIYPLLPIAQVFLIPLSSPADPDYSNKAKFRSKYMNDDGGPSFWWRDALLERIYRNYLSNRIDQQAVSALSDVLRKLGDDGIFRFERFVKKTRFGEITNTQELIEGFAKAETTARMWYQALSWTLKLSMVGLSVSLGCLFRNSPFDKAHWALFAVTALLLLGDLVWWWLRKGSEPVFFRLEQ